MTLKNLPVPFNIFIIEQDKLDCLFLEEPIKGFRMSTELKVLHDLKKLTKPLSNKTTKLLDVLFCVLNTTQKNGFEFLSKIKCNNAIKKLTIIIHSTLFHNKIAVALYNTRVSNYISKSFEIPKLKKVAEKLLNVQNR